ncbi:uncharacterized protein LOC124135465 [Haliotis rufescens]|uniref:uncharacterized protein LOC124135465 n=1 Tax=Haliotis rufescens TaxID=6454 RepID=UPI00201F0D4B|nr:uncharacterized protein LOC124135465 [Haliotis rufescens]
MIYIWTTLILAFTAHASTEFNVSPGLSGNESEGIFQLIIIADMNLTLDVTTAGTATAGADYVPLPNVLNVTDGQLNITVSIINDDENEEPETLIITLTDQAKGVDVTVEFTIEDDDPVTFTASDSVFEEGTLAMINLTCAFPSGSSSLTFNVSASGGTATAGVDYMYSPTQYTCTLVSSIVSVIIPLTDDAERTSDKTFSLSVDTGFSVAGDVVVPVTILENAIGFDVTLVGSGDEAAGPIQLEIQASTNLTLDVSTSGTATAGIDYVPVSATLSVISNQPFQQQISIIDDDENEEPETLIIDLADRATGDVTTVEVIIQDDDPVTITASDSVFEEGTLAMINLTCAFPSGSSSLTFSVVPSDGTAVAGVDYTFSATQYTCTFGASIVSVIIPLTDDTERTSDKTFSLSVDTGFSVAGDVVVPVTILENDPLCNPPCQHGGVCAVSGCMCPDGYTGSHCESKDC